MRDNTDQNIFKYIQIEIKNSQIKQMFLKFGNRN